MIKKTDLTAFLDGAPHTGFELLEYYLLRATSGG
jgi:hypothetical protein